MSAPNRETAERVDELCRIVELLASLPEVGGYIDRLELRRHLRERIDELTWSEQS